MVVAIMLSQTFCQSKDPAPELPGGVGVLGIIARLLAVALSDRVGRRPVAHAAPRNSPP
jgi:hypothetical protein